MASFYVNIDVEALFCRCSTRFNFHCVHSHGRIWNPPLRSANPVAFCLPPTSAGWGHPALHPTKKGERRAASPLAAVPASGHSKPSVQSPHPHPTGKKPPFDKGGRTVEKLHPCLIACVGATIGRPSAYRRNAISGTVFIQGKRARASNARPYKSVSTRCSNLKLHFKFHSCKIRQSVLQSHSIPF